MVANTKEKTPLVSVIMPVYNAERFLEAAIRSVMAQTVTEWELLLIDDGSADGSMQLAERLAAEDHRIRCQYNPHNMGVSATRNRGIEAAQGAYLAFLDSDDVWLPQKLEKQLEAMAVKNAGICYTSYAIIDGSGEIVKADYVVPEQVDFSGLLNENVIGCSTVVLRRDLLEDHRFGADYYHEDYVLWLTLLQHGARACGCKEVLTQWRLIENSRSFNKYRSAMFRWKIYRGFLKMPFGKSVRAFAGYAVSSLRKYR